MCRCWSFTAQKTLTANGVEIFVVAMHRVKKTKSCLLYSVPVPINTLNATYIAYDHYCRPTYAFGICCLCNTCNRKIK